jgi:adenylosuccinate synthase
MVKTGRLAIVVGGYLGDEGKGKATQYYLQQYGAEKTHRIRHSVLCIRSSGGTNTGATIYSVAKGEKLDIHMLPAGAFQPNCHSYIGSAVYVNLDILVKELRMRDKKHGRVFLSKNAHVVMPSHLREDAEKENGQKLGSTKNGVSVCAGRKYRYNGLTVGDLATMSQRAKDRMFTPEHELHWLSKVMVQIQEEFGVEIVDPFHLFRDVVEPNGWNMVLEGTQGVGLDVNHGFEYPYVSSGSFSTYGLLDGVGYALAPDEVCMVLKVYGSYFGPKRERGDFESEDFRKFAGEFGTTTGRPRNLCWLDAEHIQKVASLVQPTSIMLNCMDRLDWFADNHWNWKLVIDDTHTLQFEDKPIVDGKLTTAGALFVETIEEYAKAPVKFMGVGPRHEDVIER